MRLRFKAAVVLTAVALVTAACGSSKKAASTGTTAGGSATTGASGGAAGGSAGGDIIVEGVAGKADHPGTDVGFEARITRFNNEGGAGGHKVKFLGVQDDGSDASKDLSITQSLVLKDHVFAVAPVASIAFLPPSGDVLKQNHTPMLGYGSVIPFCNNDWAYGYAGCQVTPKFNTTTGPHLIQQATGMKISDMKVAVEGIALQAAVTGNNAGAETFQKLGATVVYNKNEIPVGGQSVDYTPFVQGIVGSKANIVFEVTDLANSIGLTAALKAAGYKGLIYNGTAYLPSQIGSQANIASALNGSYVLVQAPAQEDQTPAIKQEEADLKAIGAPTTVDLGTSIGYWTADEFVQMLKATAAKGPITQQTFHDVVNAGLTNNPAQKGGNGPLMWPLYENEPMPCASFVEAVGNHYVSKVPFTCFNDIPLS